MCWNISNWISFWVPWRQGGETLLSVLTPLPHSLWEIARFPEWLLGCRLSYMHVRVGPFTWISHTSLFRDYICRSLSRITAWIPGTEQWCGTSAAYLDIKHLIWVEMQKWANKSVAMCSSSLSSHLLFPRWQRRLIDFAFTGANLFSATKRLGQFVLYICIYSFSAEQTNEQNQMDRSGRRVCVIDREDLNKPWLMLWMLEYSPSRLIQPTRTNYVPPEGLHTKSSSGFKINIVRSYQLIPSSVASIGAQSLRASSSCAAVWRNAIRLGNRCNVVRSLYPSAPHKKPFRDPGCHNFTSIWIPKGAFAHR